MQGMRDAGKEGIQKRRDSRIEGCWKGGMPERRNALNERFRKGEMQVSLQ